MLAAVAVKALIGTFERGAARRHDDLPGRAARPGGAARAARVHADRRLHVPLPVRDRRGGRAHARRPGRPRLPPAARAAGRRARPRRDGPVPAHATAAASASTSRCSPAATAARMPQLGAALLRRAPTRCSSALVLSALVPLRVAAGWRVSCAIHARGLSTAIPNGRAALRGIDLHVRHGERVARARPERRRQDDVHAAPQRPAAWARAARGGRAARDARRRCASCGPASGSSSRTPTTSSSCRPCARTSPSARSTSGSTATRRGARRRGARRRADGATPPTAPPTSSRWASGGGWRSRRCWPCGRRCSCSTSRRPTSTRAPGASCWTCSSASTARCCVATHDLPSPPSCASARSMLAGGRIVATARATRSWATGAARRPRPRAARGLRPGTDRTAAEALRRAGPGADLSRGHSRGAVRRDSPRRLTAAEVNWYNQLTGDRRRPRLHRPRRAPPRLRGRVRASARPGAGRVAAAGRPAAVRARARQAFGVNRHAVREALKRLQQAGLVRSPRAARRACSTGAATPGSTCSRGSPPGPRRPRCGAAARDAEMRAGVGADAARRCAQRADAAPRAELARARRAARRRRARRAPRPTTPSGTRSSTAPATSPTGWRSTRSSPRQRDGPSTRASRAEIDDAAAQRALAAGVAAGDAEARRARPRRCWSARPDALMAEVLYYAIPFFMLLLIAESASFRHLRDEDDLSATNCATRARRWRWASATSSINVGWKAVVVAPTPRCTSSRRCGWTRTTGGCGSLLFFADDLSYYWFHRVSHESRVFWASHVVHHSSRHYNLSTALRQTWVPMTYFPFWLWMPLRRLPRLDGPAGPGLEPDLPVLDPHGARAAAAAAARGGPQHAVAPPRPPRLQRRLPGQELRRHPDRLGPPVRQLRARGRARPLRADQERGLLQPGPRRLPRVPRHVARLCAAREAGATSPACCCGARAGARTSPG